MELRFRVYKYTNKVYRDKGLDMKVSEQLNESSRGPSKIGDCRGIVPVTTEDFIHVGLKALT